MTNDIKPCCSNEGRSPFNGYSCPYESNKSECPTRIFHIDMCKRVNCSALYGYGGLQKHKKAIIVIENPANCPNRYSSTLNTRGMCGITKKWCESSDKFSKDCPLEDVE